MFSLALITGLVFLFFLVLVEPLQAVIVSEYDGEPPDEKIFVEKWGDGSLKDIVYFISSTGAVSGTRYRTTDIYVTAERDDGSAATLQIDANLPSPPPGETKWYRITISDMDLLNAGASMDSLYDLSKIGIGARIEIYNAGTGIIYEVIENGPTSTVYPQIDSIVASYGFSSQHDDDMKSRYIDSLMEIPSGGGGPAGEACTIDEGSVPAREQESGEWSFNYYELVDNGQWVDNGDWFDFGYYDEFDEWVEDWQWVENWEWEENWEHEVTATPTGPFHELLEMEISDPQPAVVKAGQGTTVTVTTRYRNNNPTAWNGTEYTTGINLMQMSGPDTEDWDYYYMWGDRITENMILANTFAYYENYRPQSYSRGSIGGTFEIGYNVPVVEQTWIIPYARFENDVWTRHQTPPLDIDNRFVFGGLNRWYFGFDVPDGGPYLLRFLTEGGTTGDLSTCGGEVVNIQGSPYDDIIIRTVDPRNPFPGGVPINWVGKEHFITDLIGWYEEPEKAYQAKLAYWRGENPEYHGYMRHLWLKFNNTILNGLARLQGKDIELGW